VPPARRIGAPGGCTERQPDAARLLGEPVGWLAPRLMLTEAAAHCEEGQRRRTDASHAAQAIDFLVDGALGGLITRRTTKCL
jgi:hypothetical protein